MAAIPLELRPFDHRAQLFGKGLMALFAFRAGELLDGARQRLTVRLEPGAHDPSDQFTVHRNLPVSSIARRFGNLTPGTAATDVLAPPSQRGPLRIETTAPGVGTLMGRPSLTA